MEPLLSSNANVVVMNRVTTDCVNLKQHQQQNGSASVVVTVESGEPVPTGSEAAATIKTLHCVLVGDSGVGKTSLIRAIAGTSSGEHEKSPDSRRLAPPLTVLVDLDSNCSVRLHFEDTPGSDSMDLLRSRLYAGAGAFLLCCSAASRRSTDRLLTKWVPEVSQHCPGAPCLLVVTQCDRRRSFGGGGRKAAAAVRRAIKATRPAGGSFECSARNWRPGSIGEAHLLERLARLALFVSTPPVISSAGRKAPVSCLSC